jgi:hypothetical protein
MSILYSGIENVASESSRHLHIAVSLAALPCAEDGAEHRLGGRTYPSQTRTICELADMLLSSGEDAGTGQGARSKIKTFFDRTPSPVEHRRGSPQRAAQPLGLVEPERRAG